MADAPAPASPAGPAEMWGATVDFRWRKANFGNVLQQKWVRVRPPQRGSEKAPVEWRDIPVVAVE